MAAGKAGSFGRGGGGSSEPADRVKWSRDVINQLACSMQIFLGIAPTNLDYRGVVSDVNWNVPHLSPASKARCQSHKLMIIR
jgi:hypothetical protein